MSKDTGFTGIILSQIRSHFGFWGAAALCFITLAACYYYNGLEKQYQSEGRKIQNQRYQENSRGWDRRLHEADVRMKHHIQLMKVREEARHREQNLRNRLQEQRWSERQLRSNDSRTGPRLTDPYRGPIRFR